MSELNCFNRNSYRYLKIQRNKRKYLGISFGESNDNSDRKIVSCILYYLNENLEQNSWLMELPELENFNAQSFSKLIVDGLLKHKVDLNKIKGAASDGASTMLGKNAGVM